MSTVGARLIEAAKEAVAGNFSRITVDGETWVRANDKWPEWQPIESAPRDKTDVLLSAPGWGVMVGFWNGNAWDDGDFRSSETWPTHWMPLPPDPPKGA